MNTAPISIAADLATHLVGVREMLAPIIEASVGYRHQLIDAGFTPCAASAMAADFHRMVTTLITEKSVKA